MFFAKILVWVGGLLIIPIVYFGLGLCGFGPDTLTTITGET